MPKPSFEPYHQFDFVILPLKIGALVASEKLDECGTVDHDRLVLKGASTGRFV